MQSGQLFIFGPYRFDPQTGQLWRGKQEVRLAPKVAAALHSLLECPGQVVTKEELFAAAWPDTVVSDAALTSCIQELRQTLHDDARKPRYIETVHRRGFCFRSVVTTQPGVRNQELGGSGKEKTRDWRLETGPLSPPVSSRTSLALPVVGRESELAQLHGWLAKALNGERQLVFVTGEPGIGKTTLIAVFLESLTSSVQRPESGQKKPSSTVRLLAPRRQTPDAVPWLSRGQCIEHYGVGEAYLPILEALGRLCRDETGNSVITLLRQHAPSWLVQMPSLLSTVELEELQRRTAGMTRERMLRELAEALEVITVERPLVLVLEDLHWSDVSTLDLLSMLAHRQERARLLILGSYRPVEVLTRDHPLKGIKQELQLHGQCAELALDFLSERAVAEYLTMRFNPRLPHPTLLRLREGQALPRGAREPFVAESVHKLAHVIHQRTDGNPLFMVNVTNELVARKVVINRDGHWEIQGKIADDNIGVPENLRQLIEQQLARVNPDERKVLETASVAGAEFSAAAVAAGIEQTTETVETHCDALARREQFLRAQGTSEWPDGTVAARYGFVHALYQEVVYEQISATRRIRLHRQIGEREEQAYGERARAIAAELAVHFERGREYRRAIQYLQQAGENAARRSAYQEAITLLTKGLELLNTLPDTPERIQQELTLQIALGGSLMATKGHAAPEAERAYDRARELCQQMEATSQLSPALSGLFTFSFARAKYHTAHELGEQLLRLAQSVQAPALLIEAHGLLAHSFFFLGEFSPAYEHFEQGLALYNPQKHNPYVTGFLEDRGVSCLSFIAWILWLRGYPDQALEKTSEALALAQELAHPFSLAYALVSAARFYLLRREVRAVQERAEVLIKLCAEQGFAIRMAQGTIFRGWALSMQGRGEEGIAQLRDGMTTCRATGAEYLWPSYLAMLAEAYEKVGEIEEELRVLAEALAVVDRTGERWCEAELYRLKGELLLAQEGKRQKAKGKSQKSENPDPKSQIPAPSSEAEACFLKAIEIARKQQAKSWELRASTSLTRLWRQQGKQDKAHRMLSEIYNWFTEGFDTKDLQEAKALLEELGGKGETGKWGNG